MLRKTVLALVATAALGAAALAPTAASAGGGHGHHGGGHHGGHWGGGHWGGGYGIGVSLYNPYVYDAGDCYIVKKVVDTDFGPRVRRVTVCN